MIKHISKLALSTLVLGVATQLVLTACADSTTDNPSNTPDAEAAEGSSTLQPPVVEVDAASPDDAAVEDAAVDASDATTDASPARCTDESWCQTVLPPEQTLQSVWADGAGNAWAVSNEGHVLRYDGTSWTIVMSVPNSNLWTIWGRSSTDLWVGGKDGLWHGEGPDPGSITFTPVSLGESNVRITSIWGNAAGDLWAVGLYSATPFRGRAFFLAAGETAWVKDSVSDRTDVTEIRSVWGTDDGDLWVIARGGTPSVDKVLHRRVAGQDTPIWVSEDLYTAASSTNYGGGNGAYDRGLGSVGGDIWVTGKIDFSNAMYWVGKNDPAAATTTWTRANWKGLLNTAVDTVNRFSVWGTSPTDLWAVGEQGRINHWDGSQWRTAHITLTKAPVMATLYAMWGRNNDDIWVVGSNIALHKVSDAEAQSMGVK